MKQTIQKHFQDNYRTFYEKYLPDIKRAGGNEYKARCPFPNHEDINASFNFSNQTGQYYCHGCNKKGDAIHFYGKINGLDTKRDFGKILKGIANDFGIPYEEQKTQKRDNNIWPSMDYLKATYDYLDENGKYLFSVLRFEPPGEDKTFRQGQRNGKGWIRNIKGVRRVLYHLPALMKANEIIICEGEKDVDNLMELGLTATTCPGGAGKWKPEYNKYLERKDVVLIPDNDLPGREHMAEIGTSLKEMANG